MKNQIDTIKSIMGTNYNPDEKINAIHKWKQAAANNFSTDFIDSVAKQYFLRGKNSPKQEEAIDRIITKFNICMDTWG